MQLSKKKDAFCQSFSGFLNSSLKFDHFQKKRDPHSWFISEVAASKKRG